MGRSLYRFYLYFVAYVLVLFAATGIAQSLGALLEATPLGQTAYTSVPYPYPALNPGINEQQLTLGLTLLVVAGVLLAVHYVLIRRDLRADVGAGGGPIRAFFLNWTLFQAAQIALITACIGVVAIGSLDHGDESSLFGTALAAALVFALFELERRRTQPRAGAPLIFQRLQWYLTPFGILLALVLPFTTSAVTDSFGAVLQSLHLYNPCYSSEILYPCVPPSLTQPLPSNWIAAAIACGGWAVYVLLTRADRTSAIRQTMHLLGLGVGATLAAAGLYQLANFFCSRALQVFPRDAYYFERVNFSGPLLVGLAVVGAYLLLLRVAAARSPLGRSNTVAALLAVPAVVLAAPFWWGVGTVAHDALEWIAGSSAPNLRPQPQDWSSALALVVAGAAYIPLAFALARHARLSGQTGVRRGFALALLAAGILAAASGAATILYVAVTSLLGVLTLDAGATARAGAAVLATGVVLAGVYGSIAVRGHFLRVPGTTHAAGDGSRPAQSGTPANEGTDRRIEQTVDELLAQRITRDEAIARLRALAPPRAP